uniref:Uncharacterized protein n=1 Tax=Anguilla anguilla TaxID=7936 RepID=A0A0E9X2L4_ANGAN
MCLSLKENNGFRTLIPAFTAKAKTYEQHILLLIKNNPHNEQDRSYSVSVLNGFKTHTQRQSTTVSEN